MPLLPDQKFSTFADGGDVAVSDTIVGLRGGINTKFNYTGQLPPGYVVPISQGGTGATTAAGARVNLGLGTMSVQNANAVAITGGTATLSTLTLLTPLAKASGGTSVTSATVTPTALEFSAWDGNRNLYANNFVDGYQTIVTSAGTTTLTSASPYITLFQGATTHTLIMPSAATLLLGWPFLLINDSAGSITVKSSGLNNIVVIPFGSRATLICVNTALTTAAAWDLEFSASGGGVTSVTGTINQVTASPTTGNVVLSLPQDIDITSSPEFVSLKLSSGLVYDINGNKSFEFIPAAGTPVNYGAVITGAAGNGVQWVSGGADINVDAFFISKGTGKIYLVSQNTTNPLNIYNGTLSGMVPQHLTTFNFANTAATRNVTFQDASGTLAFLTDIPAGSPSVLSRTNDTNVTITLGGTPNTALLQAVSLTMGWSGQLSLARGGTNASLTASNGGIVYSDASAFAILAGTATAGQMLRSGTSTAPTWSTATWPATTTINQLLYSSAANTVAGLATANNGILVTSSGGVPSIGNTVGAGLTMPSITFNTTTGVVGTTTNNDAAAGSVGEYVSSTIASGSAVSLTNATSANVTSISLTAGDWDVWGSVVFTGGSTTLVFFVIGGLNSTSATLPATDQQSITFIGSAGIAVFNTISRISTPAPTQRFSLSGTTTIYLIANASFTTSTCSAYGYISARRRR